MTRRRCVQKFAVRLAALGHRRRRDRLPPHRAAVRLRERDRPRHGRHAAPTSRSSTAASCASTKEWYGRVRLSDLLPDHRGPHDRRRRRLARLDRRRPARCATARSRRAPTRARPATGAAATQPTNTDANVVLGRLGTELVGGGDDARPRRSPSSAIRDGVAEPLGLDLVDAASAVIQVANANMADAVRLISIRRGYDPRDFALVAFGGAGAAARRRARARSCRSRRCSSRRTRASPRRSAACSSTSGTTSRPDVPAPRRRGRPGRDRGRVRTSSRPRRRERLRARGRAGRAREPAAHDRRCATSGQWRSLAVPVDAGCARSTTRSRRFHDEHEREYTYRRDERPVEIYQLGLRAIGVTPKPELAAPGADRTRRRPSRTRTRPVKFDELRRRVDDAGLPARRPAGRAP